MDAMWAMHDEIIGMMYEEGISPKSVKEFTSKLFHRGKVRDKIYEDGGSFMLDKKQGKTYQVQGLPQV